ncbi:MAG TPA: hypothetical protein VNN76_07355 [Bacteroidota bacterium]|nr:hypothetical protein [Bacteroidota bacterium]
MQKTFKYKLDFYYQQALIYLATLVVYAVVRGSFIEGQFSVIYRDPILYIIGLFFIVSVIGLLLNRWRDRKLIVTDTAIIFSSRNRTREIPLNDIEWMHIGRERLVQTAGRYQVVVFKTKNRRRLFRIRVGRYERDHELVGEMEAITSRVPAPKKRYFGMRRRKAR